jgi:hypothetical protein
MPACCSFLGANFRPGQYPAPAQSKIGLRDSVLTSYDLQARRQYATNSSEKEKVAKFHGKKGSDVRLPGCDKGIAG